ncbi:hypothetical protein D3C81_17740 [compost metagenome]
MSNYAWVSEGVVKNVIVWDGETPLSIESGTELIPISEGVGIGDAYDKDSGTFINKE